MNDPYTILGVSKTATQDEVRNTYRKLAKKLHPDLNPGNKRAEAKFKEVAQAYEILGDSEKRAKYDRGDWERPEENAQGPGGGGFYRQARPGSGGRYDFNFNEGEAANFDDIFSQFFHRDGQSGGSVRGRGEEIFQMEIDLREGILGAEKEIILPAGKRLHLKIPKGVGEGMRLRFAGQGAKGGDLFVEVRFREDARFARNERDLLHELPVNVATAVLGGEIKVPTPEGEVLLKLPPHSNAGRRIRIPGKGVAVKGRKERGDLTVIIKLVLPEPVDAEFERAMQEWSARNRAAEGSAS